MSEMGPGVDHKEQLAPNQEYVAQPEVSRKEKEGKEGKQAEREGEEWEGRRRARRRAKEKEREGSRKGESKGGNERRKSANSRTQLSGLNSGSTAHELDPLE